MSEEENIDYSKMSTEELQKLCNEYATLSARYESLQLAEKILLDILG